MVRAPLLGRIGAYVVLGLALLGPWAERRVSTGPALAAATTAMLDLIGVDAWRAGDLIAGPRFSMQVAPVCDGLDLTLILCLAVLLSPVPWRSRAKGVGLAVVTTQALNLMRLMCMFLIGVYVPQHFDFVHHLAWQVGTIVFAVGLYVVWLDHASMPARAH